MSIKKMFMAMFLSFSILLVLLAFIFTLLLKSQARLNDRQHVRYQSYIAADELRQSSMDLTRLARTYVFTGDRK